MTEPTAEEARKILKENADQRVPCEIWSRVMGYHRPVGCWNAGKQQEFHDRTFFEESRCGL